MYTLAINLFDRFQAELDGQLLDGFRTSKVQALLAYLVTEPEPHSRESLMELLWPGMPDRSARHNLRQVLYYLRRTIPELRTKREGAKEKVPLVQTNRQTIGLNPAADVTTDVSRFMTLVERTKAHVHVDLFLCPTCRQDLEEAVSIYRGDFLPDFYLDDSNEFEDWAQVKREAYRRLALDALEILASLAMRREDYPEARSLAERQLEIDNLRESSYRQQMEVLALSGRREEAVAVYDECRRVLSEELSMTPARRTTEIYEKILAGVLSFDTPQGSAEALTLEAHDDSFAVALGPDGRKLATAGWDGSGKIWDLTSGEALQVLDGGGERLTDIAFHPQGLSVAASSTDGAVRTWDVATGAPLLTLEGHGEGLVGGLWPGALAVDYSPDGRRIVSAGADGTARVWDSERGEQMILMRGLAGGLTIAQYGQDGQTIATGGGFNPIRFADAETGNQLLTIPFRSDGLVWAMDVSPDGRFLAIGDNDSTVQLWALDEDLKAADQQAALRGHNNIVVSVRFSPDARTLATGDGNELRLWDLGNLSDRRQDEIVFQRLVLPGGVSFAFSADGKELIAAGDDGMLRVYLLDRERLVSLARSRLTRWLTNAECQQYLHMLQCPALPAPSS